MRKKYADQLSYPNRDGAAMKFKRREYPPMARLKLEIRRLRRALREAGAACTCGWEDGHALFCPRGIAEKALKRQ